MNRDLFERHFHQQAESTGEQLTAVTGVRQSSDATRPEDKRALSAPDLIDSADHSVGIIGLVLLSRPNQHASPAHRPGIQQRSSRDKRTNSKF